jgi:hypothetical protein
LLGVAMEDCPQTKALDSPQRCTTPTEFGAASALGARLPSAQPNTPGNFSFHNAHYLYVALPNAGEGLAKNAA